MHISGNYWERTRNVPEGVKEKVGPYLLPFDHPIRGKLDKIFEIHPRLFDNATTFYEEGGFKKMKRTGSSVLAGRHDDLEGVLLKGVPLVNRTNIQKQLLERVVGHALGKEIIEKKGLKQIKASKNWLYPIAGDCSKYQVKNKSKMNEIYDDQFCVVEEYSNENPKKELTNEMLDEIETFIRVYGYSDANLDNILLVDDGALIVDLEQKPSKSEEDIQGLAETGMETFYNSLPETHKPYWLEKCKDITFQSDDIQLPEDLDFSKTT